ncbi:MAG: nitronate monooxygenase, partial [Chloroflexi bacterium]|nr:nitronate monooxygenase [Chloroflexota bacterium]
MPLPCNVAFPEVERIPRGAVKGENAMFKTRVCDVLGIEYPILQSPMNWVTTPELIAAVCNAGGLGILDGNVGNDTIPKSIEESASNLRAKIRRTRELTDKPFGVNFGTRGGPGTDDFDVARGEAYLQVVLEERMPVVYTSAGSPEYIVPILHEAGIKSIHIVVSLRHALKAEAAGVDVIAVGGYEAGGHSQGANEIPVMTLLPQVAGVVKTPVIAGGGVADARGLVAAFALGAEGVTMGTRFAASKESRLHPNMKQAFLDAGDNATVVWGRKALKEGARPKRDMAKLLAGRGGSGLGRTLRNKFSEKYLEMETSGVPVEEVLEFLESYQDPSGEGR